MTPPPDTREWRWPIAYEKLLLWGVIGIIILTVLLMDKWLPHWSAAILSLGLIIAYGLLITAAHGHQRRKIAKSGPPVLDASYTPRVSVIVPAHNEAVVIEATVRRLIQLDYPDWELLIMDDRSTDGTGQILKALSESLPRQFRYHIRLADAVPGKSAVLNDALLMTDGAILVVFDADGRVAPDFLRQTVPALKDDTVGAVQVRKVIENAKTNLLTRCQAHEYMFDAHFQTGRDIIRAAVELRGNGQLVKRAALESVGGWTEDTITDDLDLSTKLHLAGWDIRFLPQVTVEEEGIVRFKPLLRQRRRWAEGSLKRYLEHGHRLFTSPDVSRRARLDMIAYFLKFIFPLWLLADYVVQGLDALEGQWPSHWIKSLIILPTLAIFFISGGFVAIRTFAKSSIWQTLVWAVETALFLMIVWVPVVLWITGKILASRDTGPLNWGKTEHLGTQVGTRPSRLARIRQLLLEKAGRVGAS